jgi:hypothetical protein
MKIISFIAEPKLVRKILEHPESRFARLPETMDNDICFRAVTTGQGRPFAKP